MQTTQLGLTLGSWYSQCLLSHRTAALRLHMSDIAALLREGVASGHWPRKRAAAKALTAAVEASADAVRPCTAGLLDSIVAVGGVGGGLALRTEAKWHQNDTGLCGS